MKHAHAQSKRACADVYSLYTYIYHVKCADAQPNVCTCSTGSVQMLNWKRAHTQLKCAHAKLKRPHAQLKRACADV